jgi:hypothetical protein
VRQIDLLPLTRAKGQHAETVKVESCPKSIERRNYLDRFRPVFTMGRKAGGKNPIKCGFIHYFQVVWVL